MKRREFITASSLAAAGLTSALVTSCKDKSADKKTEAIIETADSFELNEITISELQDKMNSGKYNAEQITNMYLKRIHEIDKKGPNLNSVIEINPDAITIAKAMDDERKAGKTRGPLHGILVLIKDNIDTADKMMTTAGSLALAGHIAAKDAFIVKKLRDAGAIILGKTNLS